MSKKSFFTRKKQTVPFTQNEAPQPRTLEEINKAYTEVGNRALQAQYQAYVYSRELDKLNEHMLSLNQEAAARKQLDAAAQAKTVESTEATTNE